MSTKPTTAPIPTLSTPFFVRSQRRDAEIYREAEKMRVETLALIVRAIGRFARRALWSPLARWYKRQRAAEEMLRLDAHALTDIGLSRCEIWRVAGETGKPTERPAAAPATATGLPRAAHNDQHSRLAA